MVSFFAVGSGDGEWCCWLVRLLLRTFGLCRLDLRSAALQAMLDTSDIPGSAQLKPWNGWGFHC